MEPGTIVERAAQLIESEIDGDLIAIDVARGTCFGFNATASRVWHLIDGGISVEALVDRLVEQFAIDRARCVEAVEILLGDLRERGLIRLVPGAR